MGLREAFRRGFAAFLNPPPAWARRLPDHARPSQSAIKRLEWVRRGVNETEENFFFHVLGHPETTRRALRHSYIEARRAYPDKPETELRMLLLVSRMNPLAGDDPFGLLASGEAHLESRLRDIAGRDTALEDFIESIVAEEERVGSRPRQADPRLARAEAEVTRILAADGQRVSR